MGELEDEVRQANREYHNQLDVQDYSENPSIFEETRQRAIRNKLQSFRTAGERLLDVGCGTGNVLRLAGDLYDQVYGVDLSENMLQLARREAPRSSVLLSDGTKLPFPDSTFDVVTLYATLHHSPNPKHLLRESARVLKNGGYLYTDHDPNYYLVRFYFPFFKLLHWGRSGFGSEKGDLAEYFHTQEPGIDPEPLEGFLRNCHFRSVQVEYHLTTNPELTWGKSLARKILRPFTKIFNSRSFYTHFSIVARK